MPAKNHRHKYYLGKLGEMRVWTCGLPDCTHYIPKHMEQMTNGKMSICNSCEADIILNPDNMKDEFPKCENCRLGIEPDEHVSTLPMSDALKAFFDK